MPMKEWQSQEEVTADDMNTYLQKQVVARFASAATRATQMPNPTLNQLTSLDTVPGAVYVWDGTAWREHGGTHPGAFQQAGYAEIWTSDASGVGVLVYPIPFAAGSNAVFFTDANDTSAGPGMHFGLLTGGAMNTATSCRFMARLVTTGAPAGVTLCKFFWLAQGYRA